MKTLRESSDVCCKVFQFLSSVLGAMYSWIVAVLAIEMCCVKFNPKVVTKLTALSVDFSHNIFSID